MSVANERSDTTMKYSTTTLPPFNTTTTTTTTTTKTRELSSMKSHCFFSNIPIFVRSSSAICCFEIFSSLPSACDSKP